MVLDRKLHWIKKRMSFCQSSVIRQKSESQNGCFKKTKHAKFSKKRTFLTPWYALFSCIQTEYRDLLWIQENSEYQGIGNVRFLENLACSIFLKHLFWDSPFCLITDAVSFKIFKASLMFILMKSVSIRKCVL